MSDSILVSNKDAYQPVSVTERKTWVDAAWGTLIGGLFGPIGTAVGMLTGAIVGKMEGNKIESQEAQTGKKEIKKPSFFNWKLAQYYVTSVAVYAATAAIFGLLSPMAFVVSFAGLAATIYGSVKGKQEMRVSYNHAREVQKQKEISMAIEQVRALEPEQSVPQTEAIRNFRAQEELRRATAASLAQTAMS